MSFSAESNSEFAVSFMSLEYPNLAPFPIPATTNGHNAGSRFADGNGNGHEPTTADTEEQIKLARVEGALQAHLEYEQKLEAARAPIAAALKSFEAERSEYYARVEAEIVQLALAIAAKILHREAQVDSMLVATLVRMAMEKMCDGSGVTVRVGLGNGKRWNQFFERQSGVVHPEVVEDAALSDKDCVLETELGSANFGLEAQLKEVEQGFFDLLALRPVTS